MKLLHRYVLLAFARSFLGALAAIIVLLELFDLLKSAADLIALGAGDAMGMARYALYRLPAIAAFAIPMATLVGTFITLWRLASSSEMIAMRGIGASVQTIAAVLCVAATAIGAVQFVLSDNLALRAERRLAEWRAELAATPGAAGEEDADAGVLPGAGTVWLSAPPWLVGLGFASDAGDRLVNLRLIRRDESGQMREDVHAREAIYDKRTNAGWLLSGVVRVYVDAARHAQLEQPEQGMTWLTELDPRTVRAIGRPPNLMSFATLERVRKSVGAGPIPQWTYGSWAQKRLSTPFANLAMVLLAMPVAFAVVRHAGLAGKFAQVFAFGFLFFVLDGFSFNLGTSGSLPPLLAAWAPVLVFSSFGLFRLLQIEEY